MNASEYGLRLELQHEPVRPSAAARASLYRISSESLQVPPTWPRLRDWSMRIRECRLLPEMLAAHASLVERSLAVALASEARHQTIWGEFERLLASDERKELGLFASDYALPEWSEEFPDERCPKDPGKSCPFADWYCVDRQGSPCDHIGEALKLAARLWEDLACAQGGKNYRRASARCRSFAERHLQRWTARASDALFMQARTGFYQAEGLLIGALIETEQGAHLR